MPVIRTDGIAWAPETPAARHAIAARLAGFFMRRNTTGARHSVPPGVTRRATRRALGAKLNLEIGGSARVFMGCGSPRLNPDASALDVLIRPVCVQLPSVASATERQHPIRSGTTTARARRVRTLVTGGSTRSGVSLLTETPARVDDGNDVVSTRG